MKQIKRNLSGRMLRGLAMLTAGSGMARLIGAFSLPILTRLYDPEDFAVYGFFASIIAIASPFASLRYSVALPLPRREAAAAGLFVLVLAVIVVNGLILMLLAWSFGPYVLQKFSMEVLTPWLCLIVLAIMIGGVSEAFNFWVIRQRNYKKSALNEVYQSGAGAVSKIGLGVLGVMPLGLVFGQILGKLASVTFLCRLVGRDLLAQAGQVTRRSAWRMAGAYRRFPLYRVPAQLLLHLSLQAPMLIFIYFFATEMAGQFSLAMTAIALPVSLIANTAGNVFFAEISRIGAKKPDQIRHQTLVLVRAMGLVALVPTLILAFFGPEIVAIVFGPRWEQAGVFISILSISLMTQFLVTPVVRVLSVLAMDHLYLFINFQFLVIVVLAFIPAAVMGLGPVATILVFSVATSLHRLLIIGYILFILRGLVRQRASLA